MFAAIILAFRMLELEDYKFEVGIYYLKLISEKAKNTEEKKMDSGVDLFQSE